MEGTNYRIHQYWTVGTSLVFFCLFFPLTSRPCVFIAWQDSNIAWISNLFEWDQMQRLLAFCLFSIYSNLECQVSFSKRDAEPSVLLSDCLVCVVRAGSKTWAMFQPLTLWLDLYLEVTITATYSFEILGLVTVFKITILIAKWRNEASLVLNAVVVANLKFKDISASKWQNRRITMFL